MNSPKVNSIIDVLLAAFVLRIIFLFVNTYIFILPQGDGDAISNELAAYYIATYGINDLNGLLQSGSGLLRLIGAVVYSIFGRSPFLFGLVIVILGTLTVSNIHKASFLLWKNRKLSRRIAWFAALFPQFILHSALLLREIPVNFFITLAAIGVIKYWNYGDRKQMLNIVLCILLGTMFHTAVLMALPVFFFTVLFKKQSNISFTKQLFIRIAGVLVLIVSLMFLNITGFGLKKFGGSFDNMFEVLEEREARDSRGGAAFPQWMRIQGTADLWKLPARVGTFLFSPAIPFLVKKTSHLIGMLDAMLYLLMLYYIYKGRKQIKRNKSANVLLMISFVLYIVFSMGTSNFGTAIRHRAKMAPLLLILAVNHKKWEKLNRKKNRVFQIKTNGQNRH